MAARVVYHAGPYYQFAEMEHLIVGVYLAIKYGYTLLTRADVNEDRPPLQVLDRRPSIVVASDRAAHRRYGARRADDQTVWRGK